MKKMKKLFAVILSLAMVLGMSLTAFATEVKPTQATVNGVEDGEKIVVTAYQIIKYNQKGYYEEVLPGTIYSEEGETGEQPTLTPTAENALALFQRLDELTNTVIFERPSNEGVFTSDKLTPGTWLIIVSGPTKNLYNPAIISVSVTPDGIDYGQLNITTDTWFDDVFVKKSEPTITKTAESADGKDLNVAGTQFGDVLKFTVSADIPGYTDDEKDLTYIIRDTLKGLTLTQSSEATATVAGETDNELTKAITDAIKDDATSFEVNTLSDEFLRKHAGEQIVIQYYAKVTSTEMVNVDRLNNTAELEYSTNDETENQKKQDKTKHYTFGIDTKVTGWSESESSNPTGEFVKINDKGDIEYTETPGEIHKTKDEVKFLAGAEFQLHIGAANGPLFTDKSNKNTFITDANGRLEIAGLDDGVEYYLIETKAPSGYSINATPIRVYISATYEMDSETKKQDKLVSYEVQIGEGQNQAITHYNYNSTTGETEFINTPDTASNPFGFKNTQLANLPSTGGIGTTIFTIGGCAIMIIAAGLFFASRRKAAK